MRELKNKIAMSIDNNFPLVLYRMPNSNEFKCIFQNDSSINYTSDYSENGFVFAPFNDSEKTLIIPFSKSERESYSTKIIDFDSQQKADNLSFEKNKQSHINLIQKGIDFIQNGGADKIVLSRIEKVQVKDFNFVDTFRKLLDQYFNAFVYAWFHPLTGLWMGATPESLLNVKGKKFKTMALAGTQSYQGTLDVDWSDKEKQEHQFVTAYIQANLNIRSLKISQPFTKKAGSLVHICSKFEGELTSENQLHSLIKSLHPTPAVCGIPKETAKQFILQNENYNREYYTGFLGEVNGETSVNLYVNLRCMKVKNEEIQIFVGGGITKDSDPEKEWEETVLKSEVMKRVL